MQITTIATGAGMPHGIGQSNSWKYFSTSDYSGTTYRGGYMYYSCFSKLSLEERKAKSLHQKAKAKKFRKLIESVEICNNVNVRRR